MPGFRISGAGQSPQDFTPLNTSEFHRPHRWRIEDIGLPIAIGMNPEERFYAQSVQLPSLVFEEEKLKTGSSIHYKIAKKAEWQDIIIKFYDVYGLYEVYKKWQDAIWTQEEGIKPPSLYKGQPIISLTNNSGAVAQRYTMFGAYPKSITHGDLSYADSNIKLLTVTYAYDYAGVEFFDRQTFTSRTSVRQ